MKVKLLNRGGYAGFKGVAFPVEVEAKYQDGAYLIHERELKRIGCDMSLLSDPEDPEWYFSAKEVEVVE